MPICGGYISEHYLRVTLLIYNMQPVDPTQGILTIRCLWETIVITRRTYGTMKRLLIYICIQENRCIIFEFSSATSGVTKNFQQTNAASR